MEINQLKNVVVGTTASGKTRSLIKEANKINNFKHIMFFNNEEKADDIHAMGLTKRAEVIKFISLFSSIDYMTESLKENFPDTFFIIDNVNLFLEEPLKDYKELFKFNNFLFSYQTY